MERKELGETGMEISPLGFGAWAIGGSGYEWGWGAQDDRQSIEAIGRALELGINWIDTAAFYGFGHSEEVVGRALRGVEDPPFVFTKTSLIDDGSGGEADCLKRDCILREVEASLARLEVGAIDLYQVHFPDPEEDLEEGWATFAELKEEGVVRHIGVSNFSVEQIRRVQALAPVETIQPPYSLIARDAADELLPFAEREGIGAIVYSPMGSGLLTGAFSRERIAALPVDDWRRSDPDFEEPRLSQHLAIAERLREVAARHETSPGAVAVAWTLRNPAVDGAIVGFRRPDQINAIAGAAILELTQEEVAMLEGEGHF